jgi:hypothetical protein
MRRRLQERTDDDWPLGQEGVELMLTLNRSDEKPAGAIDVDATPASPRGGRRTASLSKLQNRDVRLR